MKKSFLNVAVLALAAGSIVFSVEAAPRGGPGGGRETPSRGPARPAPAPHRPASYRPAPPPPVHHHRHHNRWYDGGLGFAAGAVGAAVVAGTVDAILSERATPVVVQEPVVVQPAPVVVQQPAPVVVQQPAPVVVQQQPVVVQQQTVTTVQPAAPQRVWVEGHWEVVNDAYGVSRRVWVNGYWQTVQ